MPRTGVADARPRRIFGLRLAREALRLDPADRAGAGRLLSLALEKAVERVGLAAFPAGDPSAAFAAALAAGPDVLGEVAPDGDRRRQVRPGRRGRRRPSGR